MEEYMGSIQLFPYNYVPQYFMECDGAVLMVSRYEALYSLLGYTFGSPDPAHFNLPKMEAPKGMKYCICVEGIYPCRQD